MMVDRDLLAPATASDTAALPETARLPQPPMVDSAALLRGRSQLAILHKDTVYFLRQTRFGKLILTK